MINLKKLFKRKKGQGALEYLFMIAAALIIIFVVVRYISSSGQQATSQSDIAALQSQAELGKSSLQAKDWWDDNYVVKVNGNNLEIYASTSASSPVATIDISGSEYLTDIQNMNTDSNGFIDVDGTTGADTLDNLYDACMGGNADACKVLAALGGT
ncbi:class III signal peptide-containing protein [Thermococcus aggregans]|uniref:class III signal peptide-containing protein n=1 Tax=Thermococcus aggregans TaxID=110163 RepID=UPI00344FEFE9